MPAGRLPYLSPDDDDEEVALANLVETDVNRPPGPGAEELHRIVSALDAANGVENRLALLLEVVEGAADEHSERVGHRVFPMTYRTRLTAAASRTHSADPKPSLRPAGQVGPSPGGREHRLSIATFPAPSALEPTQPRRGRKNCA